MKSYPAVGGVFGWRQAATWCPWAGRKAPRRACLRVVLMDGGATVEEAGGSARGGRRGEGFAKAQRHAVGFADRQETGTVRIATAAQRGRQRPHAVRVVPGVERVRVDLAARVELEAGGAGAIDHQCLGHV